MVAPFLWSGNPRPGRMVNVLNYVLPCLGPRLRRGKGEDVYICTLENLRWISKIKLCKRYLLSKMAILCMLNVSGGIHDVIYIYICTHILSKLGEFFSYEKLRNRNCQPTYFWRSAEVVPSLAQIVIQQLNTPSRQARGVFPNPTEKGQQKWRGSTLF